MPKHHSSSSSGQALLIVLLVMAVVVTTGLSVISRTISDVTVTTGQEDSLRAFSAAEAGIEEAIVSNLSVDEIKEGVIEGADPVQIKYTASVDRFPESTRDYPYPAEIASGETATIWLVDHDSSGNLNLLSSYSGNKIALFWGKPNSSDRTPALEISLLYLSGLTGKYEVARAIADPSKLICTSGPTCFTFDKQYPHNQTVLGTGAEAKSFRYVLDLKFNDLGVKVPPVPNKDTLIFLNVRMLNNSDTKQPFGVSGTGGGDLPAQGTAIESVGSSGEAARKIRVYQLYPAPPAIFDSVIFSKTGVVK